MKVPRLSRRKQLIILGSVVAVLAVGGATWWYVTRTAPTGRVYLENPSQSVAKGDEVKVSVRIDTKVPVDAATGTVRYDTDLLEYKSAEYDTSGFGFSIPAIHQGDTVQVQAAKLGGATVEGDAPIVTITFTAREDGKARFTLVDGNAAKAGEYTDPELTPKGERS